MNENDGRNTKDRRVSSVIFFFGSLLLLGISISLLVFTTFRGPGSQREIELLQNALREVDQGTRNVTESIRILSDNLAKHKRAVDDLGISLQSAQQQFSQLRRNLETLDRQVRGVTESIGLYTKQRDDITRTMDRIRGIAQEIERLNREADP